MNTLNKEIPIFGGRLTIVLCKELIEVEEKYNLTDTSGCDAITFRNPTKKHKRVYVAAFQKWSINPGIIAHESVHIANFILDDIGYKLEIENDEIQCYVVGWVADMITHLMFKTKTKININYK